MAALPTLGSSFGDAGVGTATFVLFFTPGSLGHDNLSIGPAAALEIFQLLSRSEAFRLIEMRPRDSEKSSAVSDHPRATVTCHLALFHEAPDPEITAFMSLLVEVSERSARSPCRTKYTKFIAQVTKDL